MGLFLVHLSQTFRGMAPYLKGFYNTMNSWRNEDGWKCSMSEWKSYLGIEDSMCSVDVELERKKVVQEKQKEQPKMVERF